MGTLIYQPIYEYFQIFNSPVQHLLFVLCTGLIINNVFTVLLYMRSRFVYFLHDSPKTPFFIFTRQKISQISRESLYRPLSKSV